MLVEGEYYESVGKQEQAASVYHALYELFPDDIEYGLRFANAAMLGGNASRALDLLHRLRTLPAPATGLAECRAENSIPISVRYRGWQGRRNPGLHQSLRQKAPRIQSGHGRSLGLCE